MVIDHFYTSALCSPSRAGLLTGRYPHRFGIMGDTVTPGSDFGLDPQEETIADVLSRAGYARRSFLGKWHLGHRSLAYHRSEEHTSELQSLMPNTYTVFCLKKQTNNT